MIHTTRRRGDFKVDSAEASVLEMLENLQPRVRVACVVLVWDNFPCHLCENDNMGLICLSFGTVLPNVEPCGDNLEQSESNEFKQWKRVPQLQPPGMGEQRLEYVEGLIDDFMGLITLQDIVNACQHAQGIFQRALNLEDMEVGA